MGEHLEFTVSEAAEKLGVSARSIINYIKHKEIDAVKVGKSWFIKGPSLDAFTKRYRFPHKSETAPENPPDQTNGVANGKVEKETSLKTSSKQQKKKKGSSFSISRPCASMN